MASIRYRKTSKGTVSWQVLFRHADKQQSRTFEDERSASEFKRLVDDLGADEAVTILAERTSSDRQTPRLADWCTEHIDSLTGVQEGTRARYRTLVRTHLGALGPRPLDSITPAAVGRWVNGMEREGLSGKTISNRHGFLSSALKHAVRRRLIDSNPCEGTRIPKTERAEMVFLTDSEFAIFLRHVRPDAVGIVAMLPATGLRFGELTAIQVRDVDLDAATLTVSRAWKYVEGAGVPAVLGPPKTQRSRRTIALPGQAVQILRDHSEDLAPDDFIFTNRAGKPWTRSRFHEGVWQPAARAALPEIKKKPRVHDMRHTCASWMIRAGLPLPVIQRHLGHESITTTVDRYGHLEPAHLAMAAGALSVALSGALPQIDS